MNPYENTLKFLEELRKRRGSFVEPTESLTPGTSQTGGSSSGIDIKAMAENAKNQTALLEKIKDNPQWLADTLMKKIIDGAMGELPQFPNQTGPSGPPIESAKTPAEFAFANTFVDKFLKPDKSDVQKGLIGTAPLKKPEETLPAMNKELVKTYPLKTPIEQEEKEDAKSIIDEALSQLPGYTSSGKAPPMESAKTPAEFMFANSAADRFLNPTKEGVQKSITGVGSPEDAAAQFVDRTVGGSAASRGAQGFVSGMSLGLIPMVQKKFVTEEFESELKKLGYENVDAVYKEMMATPAAQVGSLAGSLGAFSWVGGLAKAAVSTTGKLFGLKTLTDAGQATQVAKVLERVFRGAMFFGGQEAGRGGDVGDVSRAAVRGTVFVAGGGALSDLVGTFGTAALTRSPLLRNSLAAEVVLNTIKGVTYGVGGTALTIPLYGEEGYEEGRPDASDIINTGITIGLFSFLTATIGSFKLSAFHKQKLAADANNISRQAGDLYGQAREAELKGDAATAERYYRDILALLQSFGKTIDTNRYLGQQKGVNELKNVLSDIDALIKVDIANLTPRGGPTPQLGSGTAALPGGGLTPQLGAGPTNVTMSSPGVVDMTDSSGAIINRIDLKTADKGTLTSLMNLPAFKASTLSPETHAVKKAVTQALLNAEQSEQKEQEILQRADEIMKQSQTKTLQDQLLQNRQKEVDTQVQKRAEDIMKTSQRTQPVTNQQKTVDALRTRAIQGEDVQKELSVETQKLLQLQTAQTIDIQREVVNTLQQQLIENPMDTKLQSSLVSAMDRLNKLEAEAVVPKVPTETKPVTPVKPVEKKVALPTALKDMPLAPKATDTILQVFSPGNVPEKDMQKYKTLVDQQALLIWEAIDALSAKGYIIPERISLGVTKEIEPRILDLDKMKKIDVSTPLLKIEALTRNNEELARLFRDAGLSGYADIIDEGTALFEMVNSVTHEELLSGQTPISKDLPIYKAVDTVKKALGEADVNNIYHTSNERFIRLPDTAIIERSTGRGQMVASEKPLTKKQMDEWELIPVIQQDLSKVPDKKPETKTSTTPVAPVAPVAPVKKAPVKKAPVTEASVKKIYEEISKKNFDGATEGFAVSLKEIMKQGNFDQKEFVKFIEDMQKNPSTSFELGTARDQSLALDINGQKRSSITFYEKPKVPQEPIKLFHGSNQEITTNLKVSKAQAGKGIFLADKIENAKEYGKFIYEIEILPTKIATDKEWRSTTEELDREYEQKRNELEQALEKGSISEDVYESKLDALLEEWTSGETMDLEQNAIISDRLAGKGFDVYQGDMQSGYPGKEFIVLNPNIITKVTLVRPEKPKVPPAQKLPTETDNVRIINGEVYTKDDGALMAKRGFDFFSNKHSRFSGKRKTLQLPSKLKMEYPDLTGTEKQITWAEQIRARADKLRSELAGLALKLEDFSKTEKTLTDPIKKTKKITTDFVVKLTNKDRAWIADAQEWLPEYKDQTLSIGDKTTEELRKDKINQLIEMSSSLYDMLSKNTTASYWIDNHKNKVAFDAKAEAPAPTKAKVPPIPVDPVKPQDKADTVLNKVFKLRSGKDKITKVSVIPGTGRAAFMDSLGYFVIFAPERNIDILNANYNNIKNLKNEESASLEEAYQKALDTEKKINDTPVSMASSSEGKPLDLLIFNVDNKEIGFNRKFVAPFENQELDFFIADHMKGTPTLVIKQEGVPQAYILPYRTEGFSYSNLSPLKDFWQKTTIEKEPLPPPAKKRTQIDPVIKRVFKPEKEEIRVIQIIPGTDKAFFSDGHRGIFADADNIQLFPAEYPTSSFPKAEQKLGALGETLYKQSQGLTEPINNTAKVFIESDAKPPRIFYETDKGTFAFNKTFVQPFHDKGLGFYLTNTDSPAPMLHIKNGDQPVAVIIGLTSKKNLPPSGTPQPHYWKKIGDGSGLSDAARIKRYYQDIITKHKVPPPAAKMGAAALKDLARKEDAVNKLLEGKNVVYSGNIPYAVKGKGFVDTFLKNGTVDIVGSKVSSAHDLAMISQVYRDPRFETFRYVFIGEDSSGNETILMTSAVSARLPCIASVLPIVGGKSIRAYMEALFIAAEKRGATGFYLLHNHPTGKVSPSDADASATKTVVTRAEAISNLSFRGHVVINGTEYALMHDSFSQGGKRDLVTDIHPLNVKSDNILVPEIENPLLGQQISGSSVLAQFAAQAKKTLSDPNNISLIFADTKLYIKGVLETTKGTLDDDKSLQRFLFEQGLSLGSPRPFLIINSFSDPKIKKTLTKMIQRGYLEGVYGYEESTSFRDVFPNIRVVETNPWEDMETHGTTQSLSLGGTHPDDEKKLKQELSSILLGKDVKDLTKEENNIIQEEMHGYSTGDGEYRYSKNPIPERGKERERGYSDTMGKSDTIHPDIRARFRSDPLLYKMMQNKDVFSEAERRFDSITDFNAAYDAFLKQRTSWDPADVPFAEMLANHFALKGDMSRADGIIVALADNLTYHGRMIQAVNIMQASKSPTVALRNLQKQIDRINEEGRIRFPKKWKDLFLTPEEKAALTAAFGPTGINKEEWDRILQQIYERMNMERPRSMMEYINSWRKFAMLSSPKTQIRNILGNVMMMGMSNLRDINGFFLERMFVRNPYDRRYALGWKLFADGKRRFEIANKAWDDYMDTLIGVDKYMLTGLTSLQIKGQRTFKTPWLHEITSLPMKGIRGMDIPFMKSAFVRALGMELSAKNVFDYDEQMLYNAGQRALEDTFKQVNLVTTMLSDVVRKGGIPGFLVDINIPFLRAPINIVKNAFEYNPTGFISSTMSAFFGKSKGDTKKIIDNYAKALSGTQIALLGFLGVLLGFVRGSGRNTTQQQRIVRDLAGQQPWSIQTSYGSYTVDWMQPFAGPFLLGAEFAEFITAKIDYDIKNYKDLADAAEYIDLAGLVEAMFSSTDAIFNMGTMRGVRNMLGGSYGSVSQAIAELPLTFLEQSWPTVFGQVARTVDPVRRQTRTGNFVSDWWRTMQARIPGASLALPEQLDVFGRVVYQGKVSSAPADTKYKWTNAINQVLSPGNFMGLPTDPVDIEVVRLYNSTRESSALPRYAPKRVTYNNVEYELTPDDQTRFQIIMGGELYAMLREDFSSSGYREATDEMRVRAVSQRVYAAYERAKADLIQRRNLR